MNRWVILMVGAFGGALAIGSVVGPLGPASAVGAVFGLWLTLGVAAWCFVRWQREQSAHQRERDAMLESLVARVDTGLTERRALEERALVAWTDALAASTGRLDAGVNERRSFEELSITRRQEADQAAVDALKTGADTVAGAFEARAEHVVDAFSAATERLVLTIDRRFDELFAVVRDHFAQATKHQESLLTEAARSLQKQCVDVEERQVQRTSEAFDRFDRALDVQVERLAAFESDLTTRREDSVQALGARLDEYANHLKDRLEATTRVVDEAAASVRAGGIEMNAVAEMFGHAVDRQRVAADNWIGTLRSVDEAVLRAGEKAAVEALDHYLARTHELFDHQLELHEELLDRLGMARGNEVVRESQEVLVQEVQRGG